MGQDPLQELRDIRRNIEHACEARGQTYADYLSQAQGKYTERLVQRGPKPRLKVKARRVAPEASGEV
ncbi:MAG: hypothetical protein OEU26_32105 [Candidatus Tectomicrobia bacterium]|nr:hypothetical protein [Candidatus Tectomicrobia bacterium]